ncbi:McrC family protein [Actinoplanes sp. ATCC 53533]|uniref:McrC family protein n=1 Tax=Actinoplanes sp. ATCC 53533 TaxID=1288362 RepID=UPI0021074C4B|nr:McrC family protein [Actinoplanes sp. ATCC 53533]
MSLSTRRYRLFGAGSAPDQWARRPAQPLPIEVTYDDYTVDTVENRLLRTALRWMAGVPRLPDSTRARLSHLDGRLDGFGCCQAVQSCRGGGPAGSTSGTCPRCVWPSWCCGNTAQTRGGVAGAWPRSL